VHGEARDVVREGGVRAQRDGHLPTGGNVIFVPSPFHI
jgi:hypothetical protein